MIQNVRASLEIWSFHYSHYGVNRWALRCHILGLVSLWNQTNWILSAVWHIQYTDIRITQWFHDIRYPVNLAKYYWSTASTTSKLTSFIVWYTHKSIKIFTGEVYIRFELRLALRLNEGNPSTPYKYHPLHHFLSVNSSGDTHILTGLGRVSESTEASWVMPEQRTSLKLTISTAFCWYTYQQQTQKYWHPESSTKRGSQATSISSY